MLNGTVLNGTMLNGTMLNGTMLNGTEALGHLAQPRQPGPGLHVGHGGRPVGGQVHADQVPTEVPGQAAVHQRLQQRAEARKSSAVSR